MTTLSTEGTKCSDCGMNMALFQGRCAACVTEETCQANAAGVGLPTDCENMTDLFGIGDYIRQHMHTPGHEEYAPDCFLCDLIQIHVTCPECDEDMTGVGNHPGGCYGYGNAPYGDQWSHELAHWSVLIACEGFYTALIRYVHLQMTQKES